MELPIKRHLFTLEHYHKMVDAGVLTENDRVELIRGEIVDMSPIGSKHAAVVKKLTFHFGQIIDQNAHILSVQDPIQLPNDSQPEPDLALLKYQKDFYESSLPEAKDVLLLIEVSDSTLGYDKEVKLPIYAESGIPEVWIIDLNRNLIEVHTHPEKGIYKSVELFQKSTESITPVAVPIKFLLKSIF